MTQRNKNTIGFIVIVCTCLLSIIAVNLKIKYNETKNKQGLHTSRGNAYAKTR